MKCPTCKGEGSFEGMYSTAVEQYFVTCHVCMGTGWKQKPKATKSTWVTKTGVQIHVSKMGDRHLINTINLLRGKAENHKQHTISEGYGALGSLCSNESMASYYMERDISILEDTHVDEIAEEIYPTFANMLAEATKRGLNV